MYVSYLDDRNVVSSNEIGNVIIENLGRNIRIRFKGYTKCLECEYSSNHRCKTRYNEIINNLKSKQKEILMSYQLDSYELEYVLFDNGYIYIEKIFRDFDEDTVMCVGEFKSDKLKDSLNMYDLCVKYI